MNYMGINKCDLANGPGVRVSLFVSGCELHCPFCQNKEAWETNAGHLFGENELASIIEFLKPDYISGFSILGGDPLHPKNIKEATNICKKIKETYPNKTIWLWTGYEFENKRELEIWNYVDVCCDGPFINDLRDITLKYVGSSNQRIIDVRKTILSRNIEIYEEL